MTTEELVHFSFGDKKKKPPKLKPIDGITSSELKRIENATSEEMLKFVDDIPRDFVSETKSLVELLKQP